MATISSGCAPPGLLARRVEATWGIYRRMIAYRHPDPAAGRELMVTLIESLSAGVPGRWPRSPSSAAP